MSSTTDKVEKMSAVTPRTIMRGHTDRVRGIGYLTGGRRIITCSFGGSLRLWDLESGEKIGNNWRVGIGLWTTALSPNGNTVALVGGDSSPDGKVGLWDVELGKNIVEWGGPIGNVWSVCWSSDGERVVSGSHDGTARVWDVKSGEPVQGPTQQKSRRVEKTKVGSKSGMQRER